MPLSGVMTLATENDTPVIIDHHDVENSVAEIHDELYRMADYCELGEFEEATASYDKVRVQMEAIRTFLSSKQGT